MNERIRELAKQAGAGEWGDSVIPAMMDIERFAELIVRECIDVVDSHFENKNPGYPGDKLRERFGVE